MKHEVFLQGGTDLHVTPEWTHIECDPLRGSWWAPSATNHYTQMSNAEKFACSDVPASFHWAENANHVWQSPSSAPERTTAPDWIKKKLAMEKKKLWDSKKEESEKLLCFQTQQAAPLCSVLRKLRAVR